MEQKPNNASALSERAKSNPATQTGRALLLPDGALAEMVYRPTEEKSFFCVSHGETISYERDVIYRGERYAPLSPNNPLVSHGVVLFSSEAIEYESEAQLAIDVQNFIHHYVDVSPLFEQLAAYYVLFSWLYDNFRELPYLRVRGDAGSGKSRFLLAVGSLCYKPIFASAASTISPLFRMIDAVQGTLVVDEGDFRVSDEKAELIKIFNNGNGKGFPVLRSESPNGKTFVPRAYEVFGPKIIATRGFFDDRALESRCLTEEMGGRKLRDDVPVHLADEYLHEALVLRNQLLMFRLRNYGKRKINPALVDRTIEPRLSQIFVPLLSIIDDPSVRHSLRGLLREYQHDMVEDRGLDVEAKVLEIIQELQGLAEDVAVSVKEITTVLIERYADDFQRKITPHWIGYIVRRKLGLKTERRHGTYVIAHTETSRLQQLFEKYGLTTPAALPADAPPKELALWPEEAGDWPIPGDPASDVPVPPDPPTTPEQSPPSHPSPHSALS